MAARWTVAWTCTCPSARPSVPPYPPVRAADLDSVMDPEGTPFINADPGPPSRWRSPPAWSPAPSRGGASSSAGWPTGTRNRDHQVLDGFVETDWYRSFLPVIVRATTPGAEVRFFRHMPMAQLVVLPLAALRPEAAARAAPPPASRAGPTTSGASSCRRGRRATRTRPGAPTPAPPGGRRRTADAPTRTSRRRVTRYGRALRSPVGARLLAHRASASWAISSASRRWCCWPTRAPDPCSARPRSTRPTPC